MTVDNNKYLGAVYSTEHGSMCPDCGRPRACCACRKAATVPKGDGTVRVGRETMGRKGKGVTVITGLSIQGEDLENLAKQLKRLCGAGGTVKNGVIEIQGDHRDLLTAQLNKLGFSSKRLGG